MNEEPTPSHFSKSNPYHVTDLPQTQGPARRRPLNWLAGAACVYYALSAITLPFANKVWIGEVPVFSLLQLPKAFVKSVIHDLLLDAVHQFGWSAGSPDYGMTHPWAMISMTVLPALILVLTLLCFRSRRPRRAYLIAILAWATIDAVVTLSFDASSNLKLFNASFL